MKRGISVSEYMISSLSLVYMKIWLFDLCFKNSRKLRDGYVVVERSWKGGNEQEEDEEEESQSLSGKPDPEGSSSLSTMIDDSFFSQRVEEEGRRGSNDSEG